MLRALILPLALGVGCDDRWSDTGPEEDQAIRTRSFDIAPTSLLLSTDGGVGAVVTAAGVSTFDTWTGAGLATTAKGDFTEPSVEDWVGERIAIVDRAADAGVFLWEPGTFGYEERVDEEAGGNASLARGWSGGLAWVARRGDACRFLRDGLTTATLAACGYIRDAAVVPGDGTLFLGRDDDAGGQQLLRLDPDGALVELSGPIEILDWDDALGMLYAAEVGATQIHAVTREGGPVFDLALDVPLLDLVALDAAGLLAVLAGDGTAVDVRIFDAIDAAEVARFEGAPSSRFLAASADGCTLAVVHIDRMVVMTVDWAALERDTGL